MNLEDIMLRERSQPSEGYILYDSTYMTFSKGQNGSEGKYSCSCHMLEVGCLWLQKDSRKEVLEGRTGLCLH